METKQETLEEAAKEFVLSHDFSKITNPNHLANRCFQFGAKWQAEKMYSEEDLVHLLNFVSREYNIGNGIGWFHTHESIEDVPSIEVLGKWFEQFKKK